MYYISQAFQRAKAKYPCMEKITFALMVASWKFRPYFQANLIIVMTDQPIKKVINKPKATRRMIQWAIKAQALADFIAEFTSPDLEDSSKELAL